MGLKRIYAGASPYPDTAVRDLDFAQNADVTYYAHPAYPPEKLTRYGDTDWRFSVVTFGPTLAAPTAPTVAAVKPNTSGSFDTTVQYGITALSSAAPVQESRMSPVTGAITNDLSLQGNKNVLTLPAKPAGVSRYIVYKKQNGAFGYIGYTEDTNFTDGSPALQPVLSETPPVGDNPFTGVDKYPAVVGMHQQRLLWGRTNEIVNGIFGSRSSDFENFDKSSPVKADDALAFALNTGQINAIQHIMSFKDLIVFTSDKIFAVSGDQGGTLTPGDINPQPQTSRGCSRLKPIALDGVGFFQPARGSGIRSLGYTFELEGYKSNEMSIFSPHLFEGYGIIAWAYQEEPFSCIWAARNDGVLLAFTWQEEQQVWGWSPMELDGKVEDIVSIPEDGFVRVYAKIRRTILGVERVFIERMALPTDVLEQACHLDCSITRTYASPVNALSGAWHLEGATVSAVFDGSVAHDLVVTNGKVILPNGHTASSITVGLRYRGRLETLPPTLMMQTGSMQTNAQNINEITVRALHTRGIEIGASGSSLEQIDYIDGEDVSLERDETLMDYRVAAEGDWKNTSSVVIEQNEPLPAHIVGIFYDLKVARA